MQKISRIIRGLSERSAHQKATQKTRFPWNAMPAGAMKTNYGIYEVWLEEKKAFVWEDERERVKAEGKEE